MTSDTTVTFGMALRAIYYATMQRIIAPSPTFLALAWIAHQIEGNAVDSLHVAITALHFTGIFWLLIASPAPPLLQQEFPSRTDTAMLAQFYAFALSILITFI